MGRVILLDKFAVFIVSNRPRFLSDFSDVNQWIWTMRPLHTRQHRILEKLEFRVVFCSVCNGLKSSFYLKTRLNLIVVVKLSFISFSIIIQGLCTTKNQISPCGWKINWFYPLSLKKKDPKKQRNTFLRWISKNTQLIAKCFDWQCTLPVEAHFSVVFK